MNGKDGFHSVPNLLKKERDGVESVLTTAFLGQMAHPSPDDQSLLTSAATAAVNGTNNEKEP